MRFCIQCGNKLSEEDKYCDKCGENQSQINSTLKTENRRGSAGIFDFEYKKNIWSSLLIYIIVVILGMLLHIFIPETTTTNTDYFKYILNTGISFYSVLLIAYLRGMGSKAWIIALIAGLAGYLAGAYIGLLFVLYPMLNDFKANIAFETTLRKAVLNKILLGGVFWYLLGILLTLGSWSIAKEGESYTIYWGLVVYGLWMFAKVIYYCTNPASLDILGEKELDKIQKKDENISQNAPHNNEYVKTEVKKLPLISNRVLMWIVLVVGGYVVLYYSGVLLYKIMFPK